MEPTARDSCFIQWPLIVRPAGVNHIMVNSFEDFPQNPEGQSNKRKYVSILGRKTSEDKTVVQPCCEPQGHEVTDNTGEQDSENGLVCPLGYVKGHNCAVCWKRGFGFREFSHKDNIETRVRVTKLILKYVQLDVDNGFVCQSCQKKLFYLDKMYTEFMSLVQTGLQRKRKEEAACSKTEVDDDDTEEDPDQRTRHSDEHPDENRLESVSKQLKACSYRNEQALAIHEDDAQKDVDEIKKEALDDICEADNENIEDGQNSEKDGLFAEDNSILAVKVEKDNFENMDNDGTIEIQDHNYSVLPLRVKKGILFDSDEEKDGEEEKYIYEADEIHMEFYNIHCVRTHTQLFAVCPFCETRFLLSAYFAFERHLQTEHHNQLSESFKKHLALFHQIKPFLLESDRYYTLKLKKINPINSCDLFGFTAYIKDDKLEIECSHCCKNFPKNFFPDHFRICLVEKHKKIAVDQLATLVDMLQKLETSIVRWYRPEYLDILKKRENERKRKKMDDRLKLKMKLKRQLYTKNNNSTSVCHLCGKTFRSIYIACHLRKVHCQLQQCDKCGASVKGFLYVHLLHTKHDEESILQRHDRLLKKEKEFKRKKEKSVKSVDPPPKPFNSERFGSIYLCEVCGKNFPDADKLTERKHKVYECDVCRRRFASRSMLEAHGQKHEGSSKFCDKCKKNINSMSFRQHKLVEHAEMFQWICSLCNKLYEDFSDMKKHMQLEHKATTTPDAVFKVPHKQIDGKQRKHHGSARKICSQRQINPEINPQSIS